MTKRELVSRVLLVVALAMLACHADSKVGDSPALGDATVQGDLVTGGQPVLHAPWHGVGMITQGNRGPKSHNDCLNRTEHTLIDDCKWENTYAIDVELTDGCTSPHYDCPVLAPAAGTITYAHNSIERYGGRQMGLTVSGPGGSYEIIFLHLARIVVSSGPVAQGAEIARSGASRNYNEHDPMGPHLHFHIFGPGKSEDSHTWPIENLWLRRVGEPAFRRYDERNNDLEDRNICCHAFESDNTGATQPGQISLTVESGASQSGVVGTQLTSPIVVRILNSSHEAASGVAVSFSPSAGSVSSSSATTDAGGRASVFWTLGPTAGVQTLQVSAQGAAGSPAGVSATATAAAGVVSRVMVTPNPVSMSPSDSRQFVADPQDSRGASISGRSVAWSSDNLSIATVTAAGVVTAVAPGSANIKATVDGIVGQSALTVMDAPVASVSIAPATPRLIVGGSVQLQASTFDAGGRTLLGRTVAWSSDNANVATVTSNGLVTGISIGSAHITATSESKSATVTATVTTPPVTRVTVSPQAPSITIGVNVQLTAIAFDAQGNQVIGNAIDWISSNNAVATVGKYGVVSGTGAGAATITATIGGVSGQSTVSVVAGQGPVASIAISPGSPTVAVGGTTSLTATPKDAAGNTLVGRQISWATSNAAVATVSASGIVTGVSAGAVSITANSEGKSASVTVTVMNPNVVVTVTISLSNSRVQVGKSITLTATALNASGTVLFGKTVSWTSSVPERATISASGVVTGKAVGSLLVTATIDGVQGYATVDVDP